MPTKIIHLVLGKANPDRMNGVNKVAHNQAIALFELGCDVEIWGITKTPAMKCIRVHSLQDYLECSLFLEILIQK
jgi:hypothetical protein